MTEDDKEDEFGLEGFKHSFIKCGKGKGIATYYKTKFEFVEEVKLPKFQIAKFRHDTLDLINVYRLVMLIGQRSDRSSERSGPPGRSDRSLFH